MKNLFLAFVLLFSAQAYANKTVNLWFNPLGVGSGYISGGLDFKLGQSTTLGPAFLGFNLSASGSSLGYSASAYGLYLRNYFSGAISSSFRLSGFGYYVPFKYTQGAYSGTTNSYILGALIGYHWVPGIINIGIDLGAAYYSGASTITLTNSSGQTTTANFPLSGVLPIIDFTLGLAF